MTQIFFADHVTAVMKAMSGWMHLYPFAFSALRQTLKAPALGILFLGTAVHCGAGGAVGWGCGCGAAEREMEQGNKVGVVEGACGVQRWVTHVLGIALCKQWHLSKMWVYFGFSFCA